MHLRRERYRVADPLLEELAVGREDRIHDRLELESALSRLPPSARELLLLHDNDGYTMQQIAIHAGLSITCVKSRVRRARTFLQQTLTSSTT